MSRGGAETDLYVIQKPKAGAHAISSGADLQSNSMSGEHAGRETGIALLRAYYDLSKPRLVGMVLATTVAGYYLGLNSEHNLNWKLVFNLIFGTALSAAGTLALNQYLERGLDAKMFRTRGRPLPSGRLTPAEALIFGVIAAATGLAYLLIFTNATAALITASITVIYLGAYTPLKRVSPVCSVVGAIPGALPPVAGWVAARGALDPQPLVLFAIMFLWQLPHSLAIAQLYKSDYIRAGIKLLSTVDSGGRSTARQIVLNTVLLIGAGMLPTIMGFAGQVYFVGALLSGFAFLYYSVKLALSPQAARAARRVMLASLAYLPLIMILLMADKV